MPDTTAAKVFRCNQNAVRQAGRRFV